MKLKQRLFAFQCSGSITLSPRIFWSAFLTKNFPDEKSIPRTSSSAHRDPRPPGCPLVCSRESIETGQGMIECKRANGQIQRATEVTPLFKQAIDAINEDLPKFSSDFASTAQLIFLSYYSVFN
jgi:hypothetical protein